MAGPQLSLVAHTVQLIDVGAVAAGSNRYFVTVEAAEPSTAGPNGPVQSTSWRFWQASDSGRFEAERTVLVSLPFRAQW